MTHAPYPISHLYPVDSDIWNLPDNIDSVCCPV